MDGHSDIRIVLVIISLWRWLVSLGTQWMMDEVRVGHSDCQLDDRGQLRDLSPEHVVDNLE
jgi:hypothetical protein